MSLTAGTRLGVYEVLGKLGAGGMGEVYRARDTRLNRDVAIKILPGIFALDPDRLARFEREAQMLAALNHPNVAQIHGVVDVPPESGRHGLVMELVDGEDLAGRVRRGRIPIEDAIAIARQVAEALEAAHDRGIVHRDLKPANVMVAPDGTVKVLDFGLATAADRTFGPGADAVANSPTFTSPATTREGVILGTAAYMAPEQARGKAVDRRADIWAFGCVLFEMLSGAQPFGGDSVTDVLSAIVSKEPDWARLPAGTPAALRALLTRCLDKDPRRRLRDIGEARVLLERPLDAAASAAPARSSRLTALLAGAAALLALAVVALLVRDAAGLRPPPAPLARYDVRLPADANLNIVFRPAVSVSADGRTFAFVATSDGVDRIWVHRRDETDTRALDGTTDASSLAVSPDGSSIAFFAGGVLKRIPTAGGGPAALVQVRDVRGIAWVDAATLVFTGDSAGPLMTIASTGGEVRQITTLADGERTHRWPDALPGGRAVIFTVGTRDKPDTYDQARVDLVVLATGERRAFIKGAAMARACGAGRIVYSKGTSLYAVPVDESRLQVTGPPVEIVQGVERDASTGAAHFSCSRDGTLAYIPGSTEGDLHLLTWMDRAGRAQPVALPAGTYQEARVSPDGTRVAMLVGTAGAGDVWVQDLGARTFTRLTFTGNCAAPIWSADGLAVYYTTFDPSGLTSFLVRKLADGSRDAETLRRMDGRSYVTVVDEKAGAAIVDAILPSSDRGDILRLPLSPSAPPEPIVNRESNEFSSAVSPGGRWIAYQSDDTGRPEIYVRDLSGSGARWQVTTTGAAEPHWSPDGRELYVQSGGRLMAVPIQPGATFRFGVQRPLFDGIYSWGIESGRSYDVDPKTGRFLLVVRARPPQVTGTVRVVLNWDALLRKPGT
jgi:serine/threonine-protein kinase